MPTALSLPAQLLFGLLPAASALGGRQPPAGALSREADFSTLRTEVDHLDESRFLLRGPRPELPTESQLDAMRACCGHVAQRRRLAHLLGAGGAADEEVAAYARRYKLAFKQRSMVYLLHVSKSAGSLLCVAAVKTGCNAVTFDVKRHHMANCFSDGPGTPHDGPRWGTNDWFTYTDRRPDEWNGCVALWSWYARSNLTFAANENTLPNEGPCVAFWNILAMRNPINRLVSHLSMLNAFPWNKHKGFNPETVTPELLVEQIPAVVDNFYARSLLGQEVYDLPAGALNESHLEQAKAKMEAFDTILLKSGNLSSQVTLELGWPTDNETVYWDHTGRHCDDYNRNLSAIWTDQEWSFLQRLNKVDIELFQHAQYLRKLDDRVLRHPAFVREMGRSEGSCSCGLLCK